MDDGIGTAGGTVVKRWEWGKDAGERLRLGGEGSRVGEHG
jgi:hypothetical protein